MSTQQDFVASEKHEIKQDSYTYTTPTKTDMKMEKQPFEDVSRIKMAISHCQPC